MLLLRLDRRLREPLYQQIASRLAELIDSGGLAPGAILPPSRELAADLGVSRFTVTRAYAQLWSRGYTMAHQGAHTRVRAKGGRGEAAAVQAAPASTRLELSRVARRLQGSRAVRPAQVPRTWIDLSSMRLDPRLIPAQALRQCLSLVLRRDGASVCDYAEPAGDPRLREFVAKRMRRHGVGLSAEEILITSGSQQGLGLSCRLLLDAKDRLALEEPTFPGALQQVDLLALRPLRLPMTSEGLRLDVLERACRRGAAERPRALYTMPSLHNPTGLSTTEQHRAELLELCERYGVSVIEDGFQEELMREPAPRPLKAQERQGSVLYLGSFSKVFAPGLRLGWLAAPRAVMPALVRLKHATDLTCSPLLQAALHQYCASGAYELHLRRMRRLFSARMGVAVQALRQELPLDEVSFTAPQGGYLLWLTVKSRRSEAELLEALSKHRVLAAPGSWFLRAGARPLHLRLSISRLDEDEIAEGMRRLGRALRHFLQRA